MPCLFEVYLLPPTLQNNLLQINLLTDLFFLPGLKCFFYHILNSCMYRDPFQRLLFCLKFASYESLFSELQIYPSLLCCVTEVGTVNNSPVVSGFLSRFTSRRQSDRGWEDERQEVQNGLSPFCLRTTPVKSIPTTALYLGSSSS